MADPARARKLAVRIRQIVSAAIETQIKDPRLGMVTVTDARVTSDLREATVFYTVYGDATAAADSARALASATGVLRSTFLPRCHCLCRCWTSRASPRSTAATWSSSPPASSS